MPWFGTLFCDILTVILSVTDIKHILILKYMDTLRNITVYFKHVYFNTFRQTLVHPKEKTPPHNLNHLVHAAQCNMEFCILMYDCMCI